MISLVIVTHDDSKILGKLLSALEVVEYTGIEIVFVDDSVDDTYDKLVHFGARHEFKGIRIHRSIKRLGLPEARNIGWQNANGRYIFFMDPDVIPPSQPDLTKLSNVLSKHIEIGLVAPLVVNIDSSIQSAGIMPALPMLFPAFPFFLESRQLHNKPHYVFSVIGASMLVRKSALEQIGGFDSSLFPSYFEEIDMCWKLWLNNYDVVIFPDVRVTHIAHETLKKRDSVSKFLDNRRHKVRSILKNSNKFDRSFFCLCYPFFGVLEEISMMLLKHNFRYIGITAKTMNEFMSLDANLMISNTRRWRSKLMRELSNDAL